MIRVYVELDVNEDTPVAAVEKLATAVEGIGSIVKLGTERRS